ncbi:GNAT family N-acetyltransferase [Aromatoleum sp.]|uniref:GNAT family N-acetyltransferase n=1 Tax=Aromatoleum sp. TaxID=2307007 RepID=UPI002FC8733A
MKLNDWHPYRHELKYRLGELTLARSHLDVLRRVYTLNDIRDFVGDPALPALPAGLDGYLLANIPRPGVSGAIESAGSLMSYCLKSYQRCYIDMQGDFAAYLSKFSGKSRSGINRKVRKFAEHAGKLDFRSYRTPDEIVIFLDVARSVSAASYQERLLDCGLPTNQTFIDRALDAAQHDEVRAFLLFANEHPVSYLYCPVHDGVLEYAFLGFLPDFAGLSPGTVLQWLALEQLFAEQRFTAFDFTEGESEHKLFFSTHQTPCSQQLLLRPSLRTHVSARLHRGIDSTSRLIGEGLDRYGLKSRVKKWLRQRA